MKLPEKLKNQTDRDGNQYLPSLEKVIDKIHEIIDYLRFLSTGEGKGESWSKCCEASVSRFGVCFNCKNKCVEIFPETLERKCNCASFFTVRGVHKPDCPCHTEPVYTDREVEKSDAEIAEISPQPDYRIHGSSFHAFDGMLGGEPEELSATPDEIRSKLATIEAGKDDEMFRIKWTPPQPVTEEWEKEINLAREKSDTTMSGFEVSFDPKYLIEKIHNLRQSAIENFKRENNIK